MELIIQKIAATISQRFEEELKRLFIEERDISEFILATKEMLDEIGIKLVAEALTKVDKAVRNSADRKRNWVIKNKADRIHSALGYVTLAEYYQQSILQNVA